VPRLGLALALILAPSLAVGQPAQVENGPLERHAAAGGREGAFRAVLATLRGAAWLGYEVPAQAGHSSCCYGSTLEIGRCAGCRLETMRSFRPRAPEGGRVALEEPPRLVVLVRVEAGRVARVETLSPDCAIDLGGRTLHWLDGVTAAQSLALLAALASDAQHGERVMEHAVAAIGQHAGRDADTLLVSQARGAASHDLRGQALFWLAQRAGEEAVKAIRAAVDDDPEREVKLQAVFALSELPGHEGVPLLIDVAQTHRDPEVRRQAFFWLGEAEDPRALSFFEQVLLGARAPR
jgi:hypothetical protein